MKHSKQKAVYVQNDQRSKIYAGTIIEGWRKPSLSGNLADIPISCFLQRRNLLSPGTVSLCESLTSDKTSVFIKCTNF